MISATKLETLSEWEFDREMERLEALSKAGDREAERLIAFVDFVITRNGVYELDGICSYTHAHTREFCGVLSCRE